MDILEVIKNRRSIRRYKQEPIPEDEMNEILEAARWAPSWTNTQCWRLVVVRHPALKAKLAETLISMTPGRENRATQAVRNAPVVIVACAELGQSGYFRGSPATDKGDWFMFDVALAMQNLTLAAHAIGLGTVHVGLFDAKKVAEILGVPDGISVVELMPMGYPDEKPEKRPRKELNEFIYYERYGER